MWRKPTEDDILATISQAEVDAYSKSSSWTSDPIEMLLNRAAAYVRGYLATNGNIRLSPNEHEIPEATISPAMDYLAVDILKRINRSVNDARRDARRDAIAYFDKIATGKLMVENFGTSDAKSTGGACAVVITNSRDRVNASKLEGL